MGHINFCSMLTVLIYYAKIYVLYRKTQSLLGAIKEAVLEVNADETKYLFMSHQQHARQNHSTNIHNTFFESVAVVKYW